MRFEKNLQSHARRYPSWQVQDVYKLVYQAALGSGHMVKDPLSARHYLERELGEMGDGPIEPTIDPISPDGEIVRVHLLPYLANGGDPEDLLAAFLDTANEYQGGIETLEAHLAQVVDNCDFPNAVMVAFFQEMKAREYPAVHHSKENKKLYRPAYRVIGSKYLQALRA